MSKDKTTQEWQWYKDNGFTHWMPLPKPPKTTRGIEYDNKDSNIK